MNDEHTPNQAEQIAYAGIGRRLGAMAYDLVLLFAVLILSAGIVVLVTRGAVPPGNRAFQIYIFVVIFLFFGWFWTRGGQTLGMRAWKIRVELDNGYDLGWGQAFLRFILGIMAFAFGMLWCLWDKRKRALYDVLARTQVVRVDKEFVPKV